MRIRGCTLLPVLLILLTAVFVRSISQQWSPLPYNIDGLSELRVSQIISDSGHLEFPAKSSVAEGYVSDMPLLGLILAFFSSVTGVPALGSTQFITAILGSISVVIGYLIFRQHWRSNRGAQVTGLVLALIGTYVFSAGCVWKETLGFVLVGLILYAFPLRASLPYRAVMTLCLLLAPFTHHLITTTLLVIFTFAVVIDLARKSGVTRLTPTKGAILDIVTMAGAWALAVAFYWRIKLPYLDFLSPSTDLYLYVAVVGLVLLLGIRMASRDRPLSRLPLGLAVPAIGAVLMGYNYFHPIFPGLPGPASLVAVPLMGYLILMAPAWEGAKIALVPRGKSKDLLLAMLLGPLSLILFAFLRSNDATSQLIIYRTFDFLMPAFAILVGLGFALLVKDRKKLGIVAGVSLVIICASTLPVAYDSQALFGVENQTYWFEYDAVKWLSEHNVSSFTSDQRLGETGWRLFDTSYGRGLPYDLSNNLRLNESSFFVFESQWSTKGAQEFPFGVVKVEQSRINETISSSSVLYLGGSAGNQLVCFLTGP